MKMNRNNAAENLFVKVMIYVVNILVVMMSDVISFLTVSV